jgi:hypothetical protein
LLITSTRLNMIAHNYILDYTRTVCQVFGFTAYRPICMHEIAWIYIVIWLYVCMYMCVCMYIYICIYTRTHTHIYIIIYICRYMNMYVRNIAFFEAASIHLLFHPRCSEEPIALFWLFLGWLRRLKLTPVRSSTPQRWFRAPNMLEKAAAIEPRPNK